jgi:hypothetical protein
LERQWFLTVVKDYDNRLSGDRVEKAQGYLVVATGHYYCIPMARMCTQRNVDRFFMIGDRQVLVYALVHGDLLQHLRGMRILGRSDQDMSGQEL